MLNLRMGTLLQVSGQILYIPYSTMDNRSGIKRTALGEDAKLNQKVDHFSIAEKCK
jgi:hypothetical protein